MPFPFGLLFFQVFFKFSIKSSYNIITGSPVETEEPVNVFCASSRGPFNHPVGSAMHRILARHTASMPERTCSVALCSAYGTILYEAVTLNPLMHMKPLLYADVKLGTTFSRPEFSFFAQPPLPILSRHNSAHKKNTSTAIIYCIADVL